MTNNTIVQKLWNLCDVLRDDGINYSDYVTELVLLLFIKMVHENTEAETLDKHTLPEGCRWTVVVKSFWPRVYSISNTDIPIHSGSTHRYMNAA